jgi:uncharacterized protein YcbK (DUF882 family)
MISIKSTKADIQCKLFSRLKVILMLGKQRKKINITTQLRSWKGREMIVEDLEIIHRH